jgi:hypothetical protein
MNDAITIRPRSVRHISIDSGQPYASFRAGCETAVSGQPVLDDVGTGAAKALAGLLTHLGLPVPAELHAAASDRELRTAP